ncbi:MAG: MmgE/PrpD family protein [Deltaproteobacteria bacterium]|nr:MmgE/PrpD family protein [Deltaproteobacteria bacterium]
MGAVISKDGMKELSSIYADFTVSTGYDDLEPEVIQQAKKLILDLMGVSLAGYKLMEFPRMVVDYVAGLGGTREATIIHTKKKFPAVNAALANAACAHALDMDDGHRFAAIHPGTVIIPAAIAAAELSQANTKKLIAGIVVGYEVMIRIGMAITPSSLNRGFHITGITGPFGAAAAVGKIMGLSRDEIVGAFGLAGLQSSGLIQVNHEIEGAKVKPINPAKAAMSGLFSCILAQKGAQGPLAIFEGEDGFLKAVTDDVKGDLLARDLGREFEILKVYLKLYAACRHAHASIDAALKAFDQTHIDPTEIKKISVETYPAAIRLAGITNATTPSAGRFSIPFSVALALIKQDAGADKYSEENVRDQGIQALAERVHLSVGDKWEKQYPEKRGATVSITDKANKTCSAEVELAKGEPENPATWEEIYNKFQTNATLLISEKDAKKLGDTIMNLEQSSLGELLELI